MRRTTCALVLLAVLSSTAAALGNEETQFAYEATWSFERFAAEQDLPPDPLARHFRALRITDTSQTLAALGVTREEAGKALARYRAAEPAFVGSIVLTGMVIVFVSLLVVSLLIGLFRHLHIFDRAEKTDTGKRSVSSVVGTIRSTGDLGVRSIAAVVAAIFLHEEEVEAETRLLLSWKRASTNLWRAHASMPNEVYYGVRRGRQ